MSDEYESIKISKEDKRRLQAIAFEDKRPMVEVLTEAIDILERKRKTRTAIMSLAELDEDEQRSKKADGPSNSE